MSLDDWGSQPDIPLFVDSLCPTKIVSNNEATLLIQKVGKGLQKIAGINPGDVVMVCAGNSVSASYVFLPSFEPYADLQVDFLSSCVSRNSMHRRHIYRRESGVHSRRQVGHCIWCESLLMH